MKGRPYKKIDTLGRGAFGVVYKAEYEGNIIAVKRYIGLKDEINSVPYQVIREINILRLIKHPNLITLLKVGVWKDDVEVYMELGGINLRKWSRLNENIKLVHLRSITYQIGSACAFLHRFGIIHRDIKPENILISSEENEVKIKICDFSISKKIQPFNQQHSYQLCTPKYRAPELFAKKGDYGVEADIWSVGCVLYEFILGHSLFSGDSEMIVLKNILSKIPTCEKDLQVLNLDNIRLETCNKLHYKLPMLYKHEETDMGKINELESFKKLIHRMLRLDPSHRISAVQVMQHEFCHKFYDQNKYNEQISIHKNSLQAIRFKSPRLPSLIRCLFIHNIILDVAGRYQISKQTILTAIGIFDEFCQYADLSLDNLDISATCSLVIASKYVDTKPLKLSNLTNNYLLVNLIGQEKHILEIINYRFEQLTLLDLYKELMEEGHIPSEEHLSEEHWLIILDLVLQKEKISNKNIKEIKNLLYTLCRK
jgi:serine/threonine protein kinase